MSSNLAVRLKHRRIPSGFVRGGNRGLSLVRVKTRETSFFVTDRSVQRCFCPDRHGERGLSLKVWILAGHFEKSEVLTRQFVNAADRPLKWEFWDLQRQRCRSGRQSVKLAHSLSQGVAAG